MIRNFIGFTSQRFATSLENLHYLLNQSDAKPETNRDLVTCFYRTQQDSLFPSFHRYFELIAYYLICDAIDFNLFLRRSVKLRTDMLFFHVKVDFYKVIKVLALGNFM